MPNMRKRSGFDKYPLGNLGLDKKTLNNREYPVGETLTNTTKDRKKLLEDYQSGYITKIELQEKLTKLKEIKNAKK